MQGTTMRRYKKVLLIAAAAPIAMLAVIQLVPYGRDHSNPRVIAEPKWDQPTTRALAVRACFDCHSNQTRWPWYSHVAPMSWLVQNHVDEGRNVLNFSDWPRASQEAGDAAETVLEREMPPRSYLLMHPEAVLSAQERQALADGLTATLGPAEQAVD
jgi:hypothetical protein